MGETVAATWPNIQGPLLIEETSVGRPVSCPVLSPEEALCLLKIRLQKLATSTVTDTPLAEDMMQNHFSMFDNVMSNMRKSMEEMNRDFDVSPDANAHSYRSSSVMSYSKVGDEPPKVFQATTSTRCAPGGIKETRQAFKDSDSGLEKMKIGHQIKDRRHVVEKRHNKQTGEEEIKQDFVNMDESEANSFDDEWQRKVSRLLSPDPMPGPTQRQLGSPEHPRRGHRKKKAGHKGSGNTN
ncbi:myeloid leukemia factor 1 isoform X3 [Xiphophorus couchianus]|uniref:myeloid leukemia factor 1 isoform X3 n=1 Tax=Xiphophorus couchianus TaxID=32473 RepID=UPI001016189B|nr:myeloid leukemia factor 1 isoform X3 [Xiphophorus couchianus]